MLKVWPPVSSIVVEDTGGRTTYGGTDQPCRKGAARAAEHPARLDPEREPTTPAGSPRRERRLRADGAGVGMVTPE